MKRSFFATRSHLSPSPAKMLISYLLLGAWALIVIFPIYWLVVTSFKTPGQVDQGPFYIPWVDFQPTMENWYYLTVEVGGDTWRPFINTVTIATLSSIIALLLGTCASYALVRFNYQPKLGVIGLFAGCVLLVVAGVQLKVPLEIAIASALAIFVLMALSIGKRFRRSLGNSDIAFWMISQRIMPPVAVVIPIYMMFQRFGLLDTQLALIITYVATNLPIVVWLMRDYFESIPIELEECAAIDGASRYLTFWAIVVPLAVPGLVATFLFVLVFAWNEYLLALFLSLADAQTMPLLVAAQNNTRGPQWWYMSVLILIMIVPVIGMAIALERYIARGLLVGAVKG
ncbi:MAG: carbohydrate ABC transporter permease [Roseiflexaceae bacterium]